MNDSSSQDNTAVFAEAFFIGNLLFVGLFYIALWVLYFTRHQNTNDVARIHLSQTLIASTISTMIFILINVFILVTDGYHSLTALFGLEMYYMLIVPLFLAVAIFGFAKAIKGQKFIFPLIGRFI